ncbi:MAG: hypothetical protein ACLP1Y_12590 [Candidatus Acidiferrales bacterium]
MKSAPEIARVDRAATLEEVRIATSLQSGSMMDPFAPADSYCELLSETGERLRIAWFELEFYSEPNASLDPSLN